MAEIVLEPSGSSDFERCECCGENSRTVWGLARRDGGAHAAYFVHWTLVEYRRGAQGPAFMVIDATERPIAQNELVARALRRDEVIGTELAAHAFELVDAIWLNDRRISEVTGDGV